MKYQDLVKCIMCGAAVAAIYTSMPLCKNCELEYLPHLPERRYPTNALSVYVSGISNSTTTITTQPFYIG